MTNGPTGRPPIRRPELGDVGQIASCRSVRLSDGAEDGVRAIDVRVAGGIHALVIADRGLDIGPAWYGGFPLAWQSPTGIVHPSYFAQGTFLRSFHGGLLFTAGLENVGTPVRDGDTDHGLHGRISNLPGRAVTADVVEDERGVAVVVRGEVRETTVFGVDLVLHRTLRFPVGDPRIELEDEVENRGFAPAPVFLLYHMNFGHPVVAPTSRLFAPDAEIVGWDEVSQAAEPDHARFMPPTPGFPVQVFEHRLPEGGPSRVRVGIVNEADKPSGGIGVAVEYDRRQLARLFQWRMLSEGLYLTAIEPSNSGLFGRVAEREAGQVDMLPPGARRSFGVTIQAAIGPALAALEAGAEAGADPGVDRDGPSADAGAIRDAAPLAGAM